MTPVSIKGRGQNALEIERDEESLAKLAIEIHFENGIGTVARLSVPHDLADAARRERIAVGI